MSKFQKLFVAIDFSPGSDEALRAAFRGARLLSPTEYQTIWREIFDVLSFTNSVSFIPNIAQVFDDGHVFVGRKALFGPDEFGKTFNQSVIFIHPDVLAGVAAGGRLLEGALRVNVIVHEVFHVMGRACGYDGANRMTYLGFQPSGKEARFCSRNPVRLNP